MSNPFDADYFLRGKETGKSLYSDYRWLPELTFPMVKAIIAHCGIQKGDTICDFGCARGYTVRAFRELGYEACGVDCSEWAVINCDPSVKQWIGLSEGTEANFRECDWVIAKDVLEHTRFTESTIMGLRCRAKKGIFAVVPLSYIDHLKYVVPEYDLDITHLKRYDLEKWVGLFLYPGWSVEARYRVPGVKDNYAQWERGNGFIVARRI